ncbi:MAG: coenzyme F420-0:L-glutamate ligase [bacterium]|nr:coenzyme F420-0:L-glutamate ligase [bacterium]
MRLELVALQGLPEIRAHDDLPRMLAELVPEGPGVLVVAQKIVSKAEDRVIPLERVKPSAEAIELAKQVDKDPRLVELTLGESRRVVRAAPGVLITETHHGLVCANAGIDQSNAPEGCAILLPLDPDASARAILAALGPQRAVLISDTFGRPWREGQVDVTIGVAGLEPVRDYRGERDREGREMQVTALATADQLTAAAGLLMEKDAGTPCVWITGLSPHGDGSLADLMRDPALDLFR